MISDFLSSFTSSIVEFKENLPNNTIGSKIKLYDNSKDYGSVDIVILGINEYRNSTKSESKFIQINDFRKEFYSLYCGDWNLNILDLGDLINGDHYTDTYFALKKIQEELNKQGVLLVCIGGGNDFVYPLYTSLAYNNQPINLTSIDNKFDFGRIQKEFNSESYMSKIILDSKNSLNHFCNIGFQTFLNSQEEIDLINKFDFESHRLGKIIFNIKKVEPILRDTNFLSVDFKSLKSSELNFTHNFPNGFSSREMCSIFRYAGMSNKLSVLGLFEILNSKISGALLSQCLWYFIEGFSFRMVEDPKSKKFKGYSYNLITEETNLKFYNSELTQRWWVELLDENKKPITKNLYPCSESDYIKAVDEVLSQRLLMLLRRNFV